MSAHVTDRQLAAFLDGALAPEEIIALDAHLASCGDCRARAAHAASPAGSRLAGDLAAGPDLHPDDEQLAEFADGRIVAREIAQHLAECDECAATVQDLKVLKAAVSARGRRWSVSWSAVAAAAVIVIGVSAWIWNASRPAKQAFTLASMPGLDHFSDAERATILSALQTGTLPAARNLDAVRTERGRLMGTSDRARAPFAPLSPVSTAVDQTQPEFRWSPLDGATGYVVTIVDSALRPVAESPVLTGNAWRPAATLPRGRVFVWQVRAQLAGGFRTAPSPPEPEARFFVLDESEAREVASIRQRAQDSPLEAILLAQHGLMEDAAAELATAAAKDPSNATLQHLADAAKQARSQPSPDRR